MPNPKSPPGAVKTATLGAFVLTLATWIFFYAYDPALSLGGQSTVVVFGAWFGIVFLIRWFWAHLVKKKVKRRKDR